MYLCDKYEAATFKHVCRMLCTFLNFKDGVFSSFSCVCDTMHMFKSEVTGMCYIVYVLLLH